MAQLLNVTLLSCFMFTLFYVHHSVLNDSYSVRVSSNHEHVNILLNCSTKANENNIQFLNESKINKYTQLRHPYAIHLFSYTGSGNTLTRILLEHITNIWTTSFYHDIDLINNGFKGETTTGYRPYLHAQLDDDFIIVKVHPEYEKGKYLLKRYEKCNKTLTGIFIIRNPWKAMFAEFKLRSFKRIANKTGKQRHTHNILLSDWDLDNMFIKHQWVQHVNKHSQSWLSTFELMEAMNDTNHPDFIIIQYEKLINLNNNEFNEMNKILKYIYSDTYYNQIKEILMDRMQCIFNFAMKNDYQRFGTFHRQKANPEIHLTFNTAYSYLIQNNLELICNVWNKIKYFANMYSYENILGPILSAQC